MPVYYRPRRFVRRLGQALTVQQLLVQAANRYGLDPSLLIAMAQRESNFDPNAYNPSTGACGVMQLIARTAAAYGVTNCKDPAQNIDGGAHVLADLVSQFGDVIKAVAAYDWGSGNLSAAIRQWGDNWFSHAPAETQAYVTAITGAPPAPLTIDASTGLPIDDNTPTPVATVNAPGVSTGEIVGLTAAGVGAYLLLDFLSEVL